MEDGLIDQDGSTLRRFRRNLRAWYSKNARDLPWRRTTDPYRIWISEIMLQQTTVKAVVPYFERFIDRFPTVARLANADEREVLKFWEGLGYYSRARNLHKAARTLVFDLSGRFPQSVEQLAELPGIGRYTAGAIASFAFDQRVPIVEANTLRLYCRLLGFDGDPKSSSGQRKLWDFAASILPRESPGRFNQALMELGATICTPTAPACDACPVRTCCKAFADGTQHEIPLAARRPEVTQLTEVAVAVRKGDSWLMRRCGEGERWAGLWDFLRFGISNDEIPNGKSLAVMSLNSRKSKPKRAVPARASALQNLERQVHEQTGLETALGELLAEISHSVTRYRIRLLCYRAEHRSGRIARASNLKWVPSTMFGDYPLSVTGRKLARLLEIEKARR